MSSPGKYNFNVYQGATWDEEITLRNADQTPMNLTGFEARMQVRATIDSSTVLLTLNNANTRLTVVDATAGKLHLLVAAEDTALLPLAFERQRYVYDLELVRPSPAPEYVRRVLQGRINCYPEVTRA